MQLSVKDRDLATPPGSPAEGDRYIVAASPTGAWAGHAADIAVWQDGAWDFHDPREGWRAWVEDENTLLAFDGTAWTDITPTITALQNLTLLGVGTTADATNPFSAKLNKALWTAKTAAEGGDGDLRYTMNKETATDVLSLLMQTGLFGPRRARPDRRRQFHAEGLGRRVDVAHGGGRRQGLWQGCPRWGIYADRAVAGAGDRRRGLAYLLRG